MRTLTEWKLGRAFRLREEPERGPWGGPVGWQTRWQRDLRSEASKVGAWQLYPPGPQAFQVEIRGVEGPEICLLTVPVMADVQSCQEAGVGLRLVWAQAGGSGQAQGPVWPLGGGRRGGASGQLRPQF